MTVQPGSTEAGTSPSTQLGKYQLVATLGQGGMGTVYLALASGFGQFRKVLVLKELRRDLTRRTGFIRMFMDEAKLAARLSHPNVVQTFEACEVDDRYFLAMEYLDGHSLSALLERLSKLPASKFSLWMHIQILCEALSGLHYAHELLDYDGSSLQVVHRDVSPQNVFLTYHGQVKVVDFGVAKAATASVNTSPGIFVGKFGYAAPEQVSGGAVDARTDVFAAGVMLWEAIAGRPFSSRNATQDACRARIEGLEPRIAQVVPTVHPVLGWICDRALAVNPDHRFACANEFRSELQDYMQRQGVRVEAADIGQMLQDVFAAERRSLHARIERATRHTGVSDALADELASLAPSDPEPTTVADLSELVEVSLEQDEHKIQRGYAHSKVTPVNAASRRKAAIVMAKLVQISRRRLFWLAALPAGAVVAGTLALWAHSRASTLEVDSQASFATMSAPAPSGTQRAVPAPTATTAPIATTTAAATTAPPASLPAAGSDGTHPPSAAEAAAAPLATDSTPHRPSALGRVEPTSRAQRADPTSPASSAGSARAAIESTTRPNTARTRPHGSRHGPSPSRVAPTSRAVAETSESPLDPRATAAREIEEGDDLPFRRGHIVVPIDSENPYP